MIDLTPLEVRQKKGDFRRVLRGYDPELVNDFLDLVADRMEELVKENLALRESTEVTEQELTAYRQKEQALSDALMTAQRLREDSREQAERESQLVIREARLQAETLRDEAMRQLVREEETLRQMRARRAQLMESFRRLLEREMAELDVIEEALELGSAAPAKPAGSPKAEPPVREEAAKSARTEASAKRPGKPAADPEQARPEPTHEPEPDAPNKEGEGPVQEDWLSSLIEE